MVPNKTLETPNYKLERLKHDDPRLDHIEASYKMADDMEEATGVTRRSQEPTNKQTPVIKGVLPDLPAPIAVPKPEPVKPVAAAPVAPVVVKPEPASSGFFGWIKSLFGGEPEAPAPKPVATPAARPDDKREGRDGGRGGRDGNRHGGRSEGRGPRSEGRTQNGEARPEGRDSRGEGRGRGGRGRNQGGERQGGAQRERFDAEGKPQNMDVGMQAGAPEGQEQRPERSPRGDRNEPRGERSERGPRQGRGGERGENTERNTEPRAQGRDEQRPDNQAEQAQDANGQPREVREGRGNRGGRGGRGRGNDRGPRTDETGNAMADEGQQSQLGFAPTDAPAQGAEGNAPQARDDNSGEGREKRTRDRYGRERGPRQDRGERTERPNLAEEAPAVAAPQTVAAPVAPVTAASPAPVQAAVPAASAVAAASTGMPKVGSYTLPKEALIEVAQGSGLQWVNSDPARIAAVQAAIAAEPKPVHVPRERPAPVALDDRPLVLVETKRDLRNMTLPFEQETAA